MSIFDIIFRSFLGACGAGILTLLVLSIKWLVKKLKADDITIKALAHDAYFRHSRYLLSEDEISEAESENHDFLYEAYKAQGLNGTGDRMHAMIAEKKIVPNSIDRLKD